MNERPQRRVVAVLAAAQVLGGIGVASGVAVGALLAADLGTEALSGLASASSVIGAALIAVPVARVMDRYGRRRGLLLAYAVGTTGAALVVAAAVVSSFPLVLLGLLLTGGGTAAGLQSRYAATDLATSDRRARSLATVVWATTVGSVLGPNLAEPMGNLARSFAVPPLAGPYVLTAAMFVGAAGVIGALLRPDPLLTARLEAPHPAGASAAAPPPSRSISTVLAGIASIPSALLGLVAMASGHAVMVGVMSMTPVHLRHGEASLQIIGLVISAHIAAMYVASPLIGALSDKLGRHVVILAGATLQLIAVLIAGTAAPHAQAQLAIGLVFLGLGWSCTLIAGSTLLTEAVPEAERPTTQGAADLVMGIAGATGGVLSGVVVGWRSFGLLNLIATLITAPLVYLALRDRARLRVAAG